MSSEKLGRKPKNLPKIVKNVLKLRKNGEKAKRRQKQIYKKCQKYIQTNYK